MTEESFERTMRREDMHNQHPCLNSHCPNKRHRWGFVCRKCFHKLPPLIQVTLRMNSPCGYEFIACWERYINRLFERIAS